MAVITTKKPFFPTNTGGVMMQVDDSTTVDNIFVFTDGTNKFRWTPNVKGEYPLSQAKILAGDVTDKTAILNSIFNHADVVTIILDAQQVVTINGTVDAQGKTINFNPGGRFTGSGTISDAIIDADYQQHIFDTTVNLADCRLASSMFSVKWYGAVGSNVVDDQPPIQKAIDTIVANVSLGKDLYFPKGSYAILAPLIVYDWDGANYEFASVNLIGSEASHFTNTFSESIIRATFTNTFAIGLQRVRSMKIRGLYIQGQFTPNWNFSTDAGKLAFYEGDYATWASQWGVRDSAYSPYSAIVVDPFRMQSGALPPDGGYPGLESWYRGNTTGGSSGVMISECRIDSFTVALMISPAGFTQNAENIHVDYVSIENCKVAYASSQRQEKNNTFNNLISWNAVHTMLDTVSYGQFQGASPNVDGWNIAGRNVRLFNIPNLQHTVTFKNIYAELLYRIGTVHGGEVSIAVEGMYVDFIGILPLVPSEHCSAENVKFDSCAIRYYDDLFNKRLCFKGSNNTFIQCLFDKLPYFPEEIEAQVSGNYFINCEQKYQNGIIGAPYFKGAINSRSQSIIPIGEGVIELARVSQGAEILNRYLSITAKCPNQYVNVTIDGFVFNLDETTRIGTFTTSQPALVINDDYIIAFNINTNRWVPLGRVTNVNIGTGVITVSEVPLGTDDTHQFFTAFLPKIQYVHTGFLCNLASSASAMTDVDSDDFGGSVDNLTGQYIESLGAVMATTTSIQGTAGVTSPIYGNDLFIPNYGNYGDNSCFEYIISPYTPDQYAAILPTSQLLMKPNTIWIRKATGGANIPLKYIFTTPGYLNAAAAGQTRQAAWQLDGTVRKTYVVNTNVAYTIPADAQQVEILDTLDANRTLNLPTATAVGQTVTVVTRASVSTFNYILPSAIEDNSDGSTFTTVDWRTTYDFFVNDALVWVVIRKY